MVSDPAGRPTRQPKSHSSVRPFGGSKLQDGQSMVKPTSCAAWVLERETIRYIRISDKCHSLVGAQNKHRLDP